MQCMNVPVMIIDTCRATIIQHLPGFDFGRHVVVDIFHLLYLGVYKLQLELILEAMDADDFKTFFKRTLRYKV